MKGRNLVILLILAAVLIGLAVTTSRKKEAGPPDVIGKPVIGSLAVNDVEQVSVRSDQSAVTVARRDDVWGVPTQYNYPADFAKVRELLLKVADLKVGQVVTADDAQRKALKLGPPGGGAADAGKSIELQGSGGKVLASLLVGAEHQRKPPEGSPGYGGYPDGCYVSPDGGKTVYLVSELFDGYTAEARGWVDAELLSVSPADVKEISIAGPGREEVKLARKPDGAGLEVQGLATNEEAEVSKLVGIESALSYLRFDGVADPALTDEQLAMDKAVVFTAIAKGGEIYTARIGGSPTNSTQRYVRLTASLKPNEEASAPAAESKPVAPEAGSAKVELAGANLSATSTNEVEAARAAEAQRRRAQEETVAALDKKLKPWTYLIEGYKADTMCTARSALVKKKEPAKPGEAGKPGEATPADMGMNPAE